MGNHEEVSFLPPPTSSFQRQSKVAECGSAMLPHPRADQETPHKVRRLTLNSLTLTALHCTTTKRTDVRAYIAMGRVTTHIASQAQFVHR